MLNINLLMYERQLHVIITYPTVHTQILWQNIKLKTSKLEIPRQQNFLYSLILLSPLFLLFHLCPTNLYTIANHGINIYIVSFL